MAQLSTLCARCQRAARSSPSLRPNSLFALRIEGHAGFFDPPGVALGPRFWRTTRRCGGRSSGSSARSTAWADHRTPSERLAFVFASLDPPAVNYHVVARCLVPFGFRKGLSPPHRLLTCRAYLPTTIKRFPQTSSSELVHQNQCDWKLLSQFDGYIACSSTSRIRAIRGNAH